MVEDAARMKMFLYFVISFYAAGFLLIFGVNVASGPVTVPLAFVRAVVWPWWVATGRPYGQRWGE